MLILPAYEVSCKKRYPWLGMPTVPMFLHYSRSRATHHYRPTSLHVPSLPANRSAHRFPRCVVGQTLHTPKTHQQAAHHHVCDTSIVILTKIRQPSLIVPHQRMATTPCLRRAQHCVLPVNQDSLCLPALPATHSRSRSLFAAPLLLKTDTWQAAHRLDSSITTSQQPPKPYRKSNNYTSSPSPTSTTPS